MSVAIDGKQQKVDASSDTNPAEALFLRQSICSGNNVVIMDFLKLLEQAILNVIATISRPSALN